MARAGSLFINLGLESAAFVAGLKRASSETEKAMTSIKGAVNLAKNAFIGLGAALALGSIRQAADEWSDMSSRIGLAVGDMQQAPAMMKQIADVADRTYSSLSETAEAFIANGLALKELGYSTQSQLNYTEALNSALVVSGAKGQRAASVQYALSKAMAVGRLDAQGLETVLASGGRVAEALADKLGTTVNGLRKLATDGKITSDVIAGALLGSFKQLQDEAESMPATIEDGLLKIRNSVAQLIGEMDKASGTSESIGAAMVSVANIIRQNMPQIIQGLQTAFSAMVALATFAAGRFALSVGVTAFRALTTAGAGARIFAAALRTIPVMALLAGLTGLVEGFINLARGAGGVGAAFRELGKFFRQWFEGTKVSLSAMADRFRALGQEVMGVFSEEARKRADALWASAAAKQKEAIDIAKGAASDLWETVKAGANAAADSINATVGQVDNLVPSTAAAEEAAKKLAEEWKKLLDRLQAWRAPTREYQAAIALIDKMEKNLKQTAGAFDDLRQAARGQWLDAVGLERAELSISKIKAGIDGMSESMRKFNPKELLDIGSVRQFSAEIERAAERAQRLDQAALAVATNMTSSFEDAIFAGKGLRSVFTGLLEDIGKMVIRLTVLEPLARSIADGLKSGLGGGGGGGLFSALGSLFGGFRANGGPVSPGKAYLVGERGPELIIPRSAAHVLTNEETFGGGRSVEQHFHVNAQGAILAQGLVAEMQAVGMQAAAGGSAMAQQDLARRARRRIPGT